MFRYNYLKVYQVDTRGGGRGFRNFLGFSESLFRRYGLPASFWRNAVRWGLEVDPVMPQELHEVTVYMMTRDAIKESRFSAVAR
jgi:hypothetical protein